jgi:hypothetical protein
MVRFEDGPAAGKVLALRRAPAFLRAVCNPDGEWDALDQLDDVPAAEERIVVYAIARNDGMMHLRMSGKAKRASGWYAVATYRLCPTQPAEETMRSTEAWRKWCQEIAAAAQNQPV